MPPSSSTGRSLKIRLQHVVSSTANTIFISKKELVLAHLKRQNFPGSNRVTLRDGGKIT